MSENASPNPPPEEPKIRPAGSTESSWCKAVPGGTGITVLALLLAKPPEISLVLNVLHKLQIAHPILNSKLRRDPSTNSYSYIIPSSPRLQIESFDLQSTAEILQSLVNPNDDASSISHFHLLLEHEVNRNAWSNPDPSSESDSDVSFASVYTLGDDKWVAALRFHTSACDRTTAVSLLRELMGLLCGEGEYQGGTEREFGEQVEVKLGIEQYIPNGKANKPFWARGVDMLGYSLNSFRLANLKFQDTETPRSSRLVRLQVNAKATEKILYCCESRGVKLWAVLAAAALLAAHTSKKLPHDHWEKYAVVTLIDCRSILDPVLSANQSGFYHSAIMNTHDINGEETLWELANRTYTSFTNAKNNNKHFSDIADVNFLMCKAIENPGLTPYSSMRTSLVSVFEDTVIDHSSPLQQVLGLEDYIGCASAHGVGPSVAIFNTIRDGQLDCACVYPWPLHSRGQMQEVVNEMKEVLAAGCNELIEEA